MDSGKFQGNFLGFTELPRALDFPDPGQNPPDLAKSGDFGGGLPALKGGSLTKPSMGVMVFRGVILERAF